MGRVHLDIFRPVFNSSCLVMADSFSGWLEAKEMKSCNALNTVEVLRNWFSQFGLPKVVVTDNGPQFISKDFAQFMRENGIAHVASPIYHQQSNGLAERGVQTLKKAIQSNKVNAVNIQHTLCNFLVAYRSTPSAAMGRTPSELFIGRRINSRLDLLLSVCRLRYETDTQYKVKIFRRRDGVCEEL